MSKVVYVSGTFDLFHSNHLKMIEYGRGLGDTLIVGVSTDELVCSYKNPPAVPFEERIEIVRGLKYPDLAGKIHEHARIYRLRSVAGSQILNFMS
ncbi:adenylyltransferase/cytidyltransferase family protein [Citrobacter freundii]|uniref:adenylyltransferase/cytidyltransferase family protein n=2 Tax=Enterobacter hormaechei TaxID=158836 RepID=UPI0009BB65C0